MRQLKDALQEVYQKRSRLYDELHGMNAALQDNADAYSLPLRKLLPHMGIQSFTNNILTLQVTKNYFSAEVHFFAAELKNTLSKKIKKDIRTIRFIERT